MEENKDVRERNEPVPCAQLDAAYAALRAAPDKEKYIAFGKGRYAIEAKRRSRFNEAELKKTAKYLDSLNLTEGYMPVFDSDTTKSWDERIWREDKIVDGKTIHCYGV